MIEVREIVRALATLEGRGEGAVLATLVRLRGSGYRRPGARMLIAPSGSPAGFVSGGCLEADVAERARAVAHGGPATVVTYDTRGTDADVWGLAMGCNGVVDVLLEPLPAPEDPGRPERLLARMRSRVPGALAVAIEVPPQGPRRVGDRAWFEPDGTTSEAWAAPFGAAATAAVAAGRPAWLVAGRSGTGAATVFVEPVLPPPRLVVAGAGPDAMPLVRFAVGLGWDVVVVDERPAYADPARFAGLEDVAVLDCRPEEIAVRIAIDDRTAAVVMSHHFGRDRALLRALLPTAAAYVGALGPRRRTASLLDRLAEEDGFLPDDTMRSKLYGPVGLDLGGSTPEEIALAVLAEIRAALSGRAGGALRDRRGPIHDPVPA